MQRPQAQSVSQKTKPHQYEPTQSISLTFTEITYTMYPHTHHAKLWPSTSAVSMGSFWAQLSHLWPVDHDTYNARQVLSEHILRAKALYLQMPAGCCFDRSHQALMTAHNIKSTSNTSVSCCQECGLERRNSIYYILQLLWYPQAVKISKRLYAIIT